MSDQHGCRRVTKDFLSITIDTLNEKPIPLRARILGGPDGRWGYGEKSWRLEKWNKQLSQRSWAYFEKHHMRNAGAWPSLALAKLLPTLTHWQNFLINRLNRPLHTVLQSRNQFKEGNLTCRWPGPKRRHWARRPKLEITGPSRCWACKVYWRKNAIF